MILENTTEVVLEIAVKDPDLSYRLWIALGMVRIGYTHSSKQVRDRSHELHRLIHRYCFIYQFNYRYMKKEMKKIILEIENKKKGLFR